MASKSKAFDISVVGDKRLQRRMRGLTPKIQGKVLRPALRKTAKVALAPIKAAAPRRTGALAKGLKVRAVKGKRSRGGRRVGVGIHTPPRDKLGISPDDPYYYPAAIELGTEKLAGTAFMRGPFRSLRDRMLRVLRVELWRGIKKQVKGGGK